MKALEEAAARGWLLDCGGCRSEMLRAWERRCAEAGRPCGVLRLPRGRMAHVSVRPPGGQLISRTGVEAINSWLRPRLGDREGLHARRGRVRARLRDHGASAGLMPLLCDAVHEHASPCADAGEWFYGVSGGGKSYRRCGPLKQEAARLARAQARAAWRALAGVGRVPQMCADRDMPAGELAGLTRELFRLLGVPHLRVRVERGSLPPRVSVSYPGRCGGPGDGPRATVLRILGRAFPGFGNTQPAGAGHGDSRWGHVQPY
jgi:hypothetical protein